LSVDPTGNRIEYASHEDGIGENIWQPFNLMPGKIYHVGNINITCDHYHRWQEVINRIEVVI